MTAKGGRCLCGAVSYEYEGDENWSGYCHCESCRRNTSAPVAAFFGVSLDKFTYTGTQPAVYHSSPGVRRSFCQKCGTPIAFESDRFSNEIHLYAASLDEPADYQPEFHVHYGERLPWFETADDLPRHERGGSD